MISTSPGDSNRGRGEFVGPYQLIRPLGRGGMGDVHLARRADGQYSKMVAVKRLHASTAKSRERFFAERQILAQLNHPNIAALLDGGETPAGELYVVMEYIDGEPLLDYANRTGIAVDDRLRLFRQVCTAVQHAHQHLIVHRDLKPSNVLVTHDGTVKLIDFGIAKALFPDPLDLSPLETQPGEAMLTPLYASPEQLRAESVTTASDVYSLGVLLFELLSGSLPYPAAARGPQLAEAICRTAPRTLSQAAAENSRIRWTPQLEGDLDTIVAMALRKEPERRYGSVEQLASDVQRHRDGFPVSARPDTWRYRLTRFVGRHRAMVAVAIIIAALLTGSSVINYRTARQAEQERDTSRAVADFLASIFAVTDPFSSGPKPKEVTAADLLARGEERIETELKSKPDVQARLLMTIGLTYEHTGVLDRARRAFDRALQIRLALAGERSAPVAETLREQGRLLQVQGKYQEAEQLLRRALAIQQSVLPANDRETLRTMDTLGLVLQRQGRLQESAALLKPVIDHLRARGEDRTGSYDDLYEDSLNNYALLTQDLGQLSETEATRRTLVELERKRDGDMSGNFLVDLASLGAVIRDREAYDEAEPILRRAVEGHRKTLQPGSAALMNSTHHLAICLQRMGRLDEAEALWKEIRPQRIKLLGEKNRFVGSDWAAWGEWLQYKGDLEGAEAAVRKGIEIREAALGPKHPSHGSTHSRLARILEAKGDLAGAEREFRFAVNTYRTAHGDSNPRTTAGAEMELGSLLWRMGRTSEAEPLLRHAYEVRRQSLPQTDRQLADSMQRYGRFLVASGRDREGKPLIDQAKAADSALRAGR